MLFVLIVILLLIGLGIWGWPLLAGLLGVSAVADKDTALQRIRELMLTYDISTEEVNQALTAPAPLSAEAPQRSKRDIAKTLFTYLGAIFIISGVGTYIGMFWDSMGPVMRVFVTLGVGYILLFVLLSALVEQKYPRAILPLTLGSTVMMVSGWFVLIKELFPQGDNWRLATLFVFGVTAIHWGAFLTKYPRTLFAFMALLFVYGFLWVGLDMLDVPFAWIAIIVGASLFLVATALENTDHKLLTEPGVLLAAIWLNTGLFDLVSQVTSPSWASTVIGISLMLTAYGLHRANRYQRLIGLGYLVGSIMFYTGLFELLQDTPVELLYLAVTAALLYASVMLRSRTLLLTTVLAMLAYIGYFSAQHFADSLGWPITLMLMGIAFLGVGTIAMKLRRQI